jgi:hypothetical protein
MWIVFAILAALLFFNWTKNKNASNQNSQPTDPGYIGDSGDHHLQDDSYHHNNDDDVNNSTDNNNSSDWGDTGSDCSGDIGGNDGGGGE